MELGFKQMHPECQLREIRRQREPLLAEADVLVNRAEDNGADATAARQYRQALRDITTTYADRLDELQWPAKP